MLHQNPTSPIPWKSLPSTIKNGDSLLLDDGVKLLNPTYN